MANDVDRLAREIAGGGERRRGDAQVTATVLGVDSDGTTWVSIPGGAEATPCAGSTVAASPGDRVLVTIGRGRATVTGNMSSPSTGDGAANEARATAEAAQESADGAQSTADTAKTAAGKAQTAADAAQKTADSKGGKLWTVRTGYSYTLAQWQGCGDKSYSGTWSCNADDAASVAVGDDVAITGAISDQMGGTAMVIGTVTAKSGASLTVQSKHLLVGSDSVANAAGTATSYMALVGSGLRIAKSDPATATTYSEQTDGGLDVYVEGKRRAHYGTGTVIGDEGGARVEIGSDGVKQHAGNGAATIETTLSDELATLRENGAYIVSDAPFTADGSTRLSLVATVKDHLDAFDYAGEDGDVSWLLQAANLIVKFPAAPFVSATGDWQTRWYVRWDADDPYVVHYGASYNSLSEMSVTSATLAYASDARVVGRLFVNGVDVSCPFPVGSIYLSMSQAHPSTIWLGTKWEAVAKGRVLIGTGPLSDDANTTSDWGSGPGAYMNSDIGEMGGTNRLTERELPPHRHGIDRVGDDASKLGGSNPSDAGAVWRTNPGKTSVKVSTESEGDGSQVLPPYLAVAMWKRTA